MENTYENLAEFTDVDQAADPAVFVDLLQRLDAMPQTVRLRELSYARLGTGRGVDVGSGRGTVVAQLTARGLTAFGVDLSAAMVAEAERLNPGHDFRVGDAYALPAGDGELDWYHSERVYIHLDDPDRAAAEAHRVLRPGGRIVLVDLDSDAMSVATDHPRAARAVLAASSDNLANGRSGVRAADTLRAAGFVDVEVQPYSPVHTDPAVVWPLYPGPGLAIAQQTGAITAAEAEALTAEAWRRGADGTFLAVPALFVVSASKPA
ncbi:methyltransferase domain-containing protein [Actinokineospora sp. G85]|uniref:methyltransferase domain-containing protein n=1 Tax=Actinokineospora sp. G85 TaxID=3406626 RepID=UPI003C74349C